MILLVRVFGCMRSRSWFGICGSIVDFYSIWLLMMVLILKGWGRF